MKFEGKKIAEEVLNNLKLKGEIATILVGEDKASAIYTNLKKQAAEKVGLKMNVLKFGENIDFEIVKNNILKLNVDNHVDGIMIQLPLPERLKKHTQELIQLIKPQKDVDGLREDSNFTPATVRAVLTILEISKAKGKIAIVGSKGVVGKSLMKKLEATGFDIGDNLNDLVNFDVVISATGQSNLIKPEMIKQNSVLIDVGAPKPEFSEECYKKASFYTPVPGGVGPMTIASLMQNMQQAVSSQK